MVTQSIIMHSVALVDFMMVVIHHFSPFYDLVIDRNAKDRTKAVTKVSDLVFEADEAGDHRLNATLDVFGVGAVLDGYLTGTTRRVLVMGAEIFVVRTGVNILNVQNTVLLNIPW